MSTTLALPSLATPTPSAAATGSANYRHHDPAQSRPFICPFPNCDGRFHRKFTLHEHMKTHTGEQPHQCPIASCGKRFSTSGNLARHKRLHALHKMECPAAGCTRIFTSHEMLVKHQKVHVGTAVHSCALAGCGKTFSTAGNLTRHMKTQHGFAGPQHASSRRHVRHLTFQHALAGKSSPSGSACSSAGPSSPGSANESPNEEFPVVDYDRMLFMPPPTERHLFDTPAAAARVLLLKQEQPQPSNEQQHQLQHILFQHHQLHQHHQQLHNHHPHHALSTLPRQPNHQFPSNASLSDQDLQHLFECLF